MKPRTEILGLIPARGGSKGLPGKNLLPLCGKPLIAWTIEAALASESIGRLIVSTDSHEIAERARQFGAEVPFMRPAELAADDTPAATVVMHAIEMLEKQDNYRPSIIVLLQPTSPLRTSEDIDNAVGMLEDANIGPVISVVRLEKPLHWAMRLSPDGRLEPFFSSGETPAVRQAAPELYMPNGAVYAARTSALIENNGSFSAGTDVCAYVMDKERSVDIDDRLDMMIAQCILEKAGHFDNP